MMDLEVITPDDYIGEADIAAAEAGFRPPRETLVVHAPPYVGPERRTVAEMGLLDAEAIREIDSEVQRTIEAAVVFAEASEDPSPEDVPTNVYVSYGGSHDA